MRNPILHESLRAFAIDAAAWLGEDVLGGAEIPFELVESGLGNGTPLLCWRPLTREFLADRVPQLRGLSSYAPAVRAMEHHAGLEGYLLDRGMGRVPPRLRERADAAAFLLLEHLLEGRSEMSFDPTRFEEVFGQLERSLREGRTETVILTWLSGMRLDPGTAEIPLGDGFSLVRTAMLPDAPLDALRGDEDPPELMAVLRIDERPGGPQPIAQARRRFRLLLSALRLYEKGTFALGPVAWARRGGGSWRTVPLGVTGRPGPPFTLPAEQEDEFRAFCNLVGRRTPARGEIAWALRRFEMGCERMAPLEAISDHLQALRALLEPEGPSSGRLAQRLATICALPPERAAMAQRITAAVDLERAIITGATLPGRDASRLPAELEEHLRAVLRDVVCGHLDADLAGLADEILAEAADSLEDEETTGDFEPVEPDPASVSATVPADAEPQGALGWP